MKPKRLANQPLVSVIVPTKDSASTLDSCLDSIVHQSYPSLELIVVDNNSHDTTLAIAKKYTRFVFTKGPERSAQRNFGAKKGKGKFFLFIDSDMVLSKDVVADCVRLSLSDSSQQALIIPEESFGIGFWAACKKLERSFYIGVDWVEAPRFFTRGAFETVHGFDEALCGPEDWDIYQRTVYHYGSTSIGRIPSFIFHNEGRLSLWKTIKKKFYYTKHIGSYRDKRANKEAYAKQANGFARYGLFFRDPVTLFRNPLLGFGMLFMKSLEFAFGACGLMVSKFSQKRMVIHS